MKVANIIAGAICAIVAAGCALPRYADVQVGGANTAAETVRTSLVVEFAPVLPGKPFNETVWDNVSGPIWSPTESQRIGFTQNYEGAVLAAALPPTIARGMVASGSLPIVRSRIMMPLGRLVVGSLHQIGSNVTICFAPDCSTKAKAEDPQRKLVRVRFQNFWVSESSPNHLTVEGVGNVSIEEAGRPMKTVPLTRKLAEQSITSEGYFHSDFIRAMNKIGNRFAADIVGDILSAAESI